MRPAQILTYGIWFGHCWSMAVYYSESECITLQSKCQLTFGRDLTENMLPVWYIAIF